MCDIECEEGRQTAGDTLSCLLGPFQQDLPPPATQLCIVTCTCHLQWILSKVDSLSRFLLAQRSIRK